MALGFAAFLLFMRSEKKTDNRFYGKINGTEYPINDDKAQNLFDKWQQGEIEKCLADTAIFGIDLSLFPGFADAVNHYLGLLQQDGVVNTVRSILTKKTVV